MVLGESLGRRALRVLQTQGHGAGVGLCAGGRFHHHCGRPDWVVWRPKEKNICNSPSGTDVCATSGLGPIAGAIASLGTIDACACLNYTRHPNFIF